MVSSSETSTVRRAVAVDTVCGCGARIAVRGEIPSALPKAAICAACAKSFALGWTVVDGGGGLEGCVACGHPELYTRKSLPPALGIAIVVAAAILAPATHYASLAGAALLDLTLYFVLPEVSVCYACHARHRGFARTPRHPRFDHQIAERLKFGPRAVMGKPMRPSGTAGAPDPEH